jgi:hypothetical protein
MSKQEKLIAELEQLTGKKVQITNEPIDLDKISSEDLAKFWGDGWRDYWIANQMMSDTLNSFISLDTTTKLNEVGYLTTGQLNKINTNIGILADVIKDTVTHINNITLTHKQ